MEIYFLNRKIQSDFDAQKFDSSSISLQECQFFMTQNEAFGTII